MSSSYIDNQDGTITKTTRISIYAIIRAPPDKEKTQKNPDYKFFFNNATFTQTTYCQIEGTYYPAYFVGIKCYSTKNETPLFVPVYKLGKLGKHGYGKISEIPNIDYSRLSKIFISPNGNITFSRNGSNYDLLTYV